jgi:5-methylcytosine-specific restriction protein B
MISDQAKKVLLLLRDRKNVLLDGAPATGKTLLVSEVREAFEGIDVSSYDPNAAIAIPKAGGIGVAEWMPSPLRNDRRVFSTAFFSGTKHRDFVRGIVPVPGEGSLTFRVSRGTLFEAAEHAKTSNGTSLVVIEEISRGPAVAAFGGSIVAFEGDKRLADDGSVLPTTTFFETFDNDGNRLEYALPSHLYLLATMNRADTSVEALDVAFLRRWAPFKLYPDRRILDDFFAVASDSDPTPPVATNPGDLHRAAIEAWSAVNRRITSGRGADFQVGHGVLMGVVPEPADGDLVRAYRYISESWEMIMSHIAEVFFGDERAIAEVLSIGPHNPQHPYGLREFVFAGEPRTELTLNPEGVDIFGVLRAVAFAAE